MIPPGATIIQNAWVVPDLDAAMRRWHASMGVGPFLVMRHLRTGDAHHRGVRVDTDFSVAIAQAGPVQVELIAQHDDTPSCYRETVPKGATAFHHVAVIVPDYDAELARYRAHGFEPASWGVFGDLRFSYIDTHAALGCMVELVEDTPSIRAFFARVAGAHAAWDGRGEPWIEA